MFQRFLLLVSLLALPALLQGQAVAFSTYPVAGEFALNNQLCCYDSRRTAYFRYYGETAKLDQLRLDASMFYSGSLQVSFLQISSASNLSEYTVLETWTGQSFGYDTPLAFGGGSCLQSGGVFGVQVVVVPGAAPDPQSTSSAAVWRENLDRRPDIGLTPNPFSS